MVNTKNTIVGLDSLLSKLDSVEKDLKYGGGRFALRKAAILVLEKAKENASKVDDPKTKEEIAKNIVLRWNGRRFRSKGDLGWRIGVLGGARAVLTDTERRKTERRRARRGQTSLDELGEVAGAGKNNPGGDTWYWRFLEFGTSRVRAHPFLRSALTDNINAATDTFVTEYEKALDRAIKRATKQAAQR